MLQSILTFLLLFLAVQNYAMVTKTRKLVIEPEDWTPLVDPVTNEYVVPEVDQNATITVNLVHFNELKLLSPLLLCPFEIYKEFGYNINVFTPNISLIENNLPFTIENMTYYPYDELEQLFEGTPIYDFYMQKTYLQTEWSGIALSNMIRAAATYKLGGMYTDLDLLLYDKITLDSFVSISQCPPYKRASNNFLLFPKRHPMIWDVMKTIPLTFHATTYGSTGIIPYNRTFMECYSFNDTSQKYELKSTAKNYCSSFRISEHLAVYPINCDEQDYFVMRYQKLPCKIASQLSRGVGIHYWNIGRQVVGKCMHEDAIMAVLFRERCPLIYEEHSYNFICNENILLEEFLFSPYLKGTCVNWRSIEMQQCQFNKTNEIINNSCDGNHHIYNQQSNGYEFRKNIQQSKIMNNQNEYKLFNLQKLVREDENQKDYNLVYQGSKDGMDVKKMIDQIQNKSSLLFVFQDNLNRIFGAYISTNITFQKDDQQTLSCIEDQHAYLYLFETNERYDIKKEKATFALCLDFQANELYFGFNNYQGDLQISRKKLKQQTIFVDTLVASSLGFGTSYKAPIDIDQKDQWDHIIPVREIVLKEAEVFEII